MCYFLLKKRKEALVLWVEMESEIERLHEKLKRHRTVEIALILLVLLFGLCYVMEIRHENMMRVVYDQMKEDVKAIEPDQDDILTVEREFSDGPLLTVAVKTKANVTSHEITPSESDPVPISVDLLSSGNLVVVWLARKEDQAAAWRDIYAAKDGKIELLEHEIGVYVPEYTLYPHILFENK
jgi:hypothetical protein